jgi:predicted metal-binding protein
MSKHKPLPDTMHPTPTGWEDVILICKKCSKKLSGGFGEGQDEPLRKALRGALKATGKRGRVGLIEVSCFGVCPKKAVTVTFGSAPAELLIVPAGFDLRALAERAKSGERKDVLF